MVDTFKIQASTIPMNKSSIYYSDGNGYINDFTSSTIGNNFLMIDETVTDDIDYNTGYDSTGSDFYRFLNDLPFGWSAPGGIINYVRMHTRIKQTGSITDSYLGVTDNSGASIFFSTKKLPLTNKYSKYTATWDKNPHSGVSWSWSDVCGIQLGLKYSRDNDFKFTFNDLQNDGGTYIDVLKYGDYIYAACGDDGIKAYTFTDSFTLKDEQDDGGYYRSICSDGTYIYVACSDQGIRAYTFDGTNFSQASVEYEDGEYFDVWSDGTYIYVANFSKGIRAYTFDGSNFTLKDTLDNGGFYYGVWGDGTYIYAACYDDGIRAYTFDGTNFTLKDTLDDGGYYMDMWGDGTYIYTACYDDGIRAYTFDGTNFALQGTKDDGGFYYDTWGDGTYIYATTHTGGIRAYTFDGSNFTLKDTRNDGGSYYGIFGDGTYIYTACDTNGIAAYEFIITIAISQCYLEVNYVSTLDYNIERPEKLSLIHTRNTNRINLWDDTFHTYDINRQDKKLFMSGTIHNNPESAVSLSNLTGSTVSITNIGSLSCFEGEYKIENYSYNKESEYPEIYRWDMSLESTKI